MHRLPVHLGGRKLKVTSKDYCSSWKNKFAFYLGSSNGTVCVLLKDGSFSFYSLFTGDSWRVVDTPPRQHGVLAPFWLCFGFGYDGDDYKIMVVCKYVSYGRRKGISLVQNEGNSLYWVYSFRESVWKPLEGFPYAAYHWLYHKPQALSFNGFLHWLAIAKGPKMESEQLAIVTYDLYRCKFGEMLVSCDVNLSSRACAVAELDGQLCCWISDPKRGRYELLVMKEYGVEESWTALIRVSSETSAFSREWLYFHTPMVLYECGDGKKGVLFVNHRRGLLYWYNIDNGERRAIYERDWPKRMMKQPTINE